MKDFFIMKRLETSCDLNQSFPDLGLFYSRPCFVVLVDQFHQVSSLCKFHHNTQIPGEVVIEGLLEPDYVVIVERG